MADLKARIAKRAAQEFHDGDVANLGIGLPTMVADYLPEGVDIILHSENGFTGLAGAAEKGKEDVDVINSGGGYVTHVPHGNFFGSEESFSIIRGGHVDAMAAAELYYSQYLKLARNSRVDIVAHYDLITKFDEPTVKRKQKQEQEPIFDIEDKAYLEAAFEGMRALVKSDKIFEINTGAVSRGYRKSFYPSERLLRELKNMGGRITLGADAHRPEHAGFMMEEAAEYAAKCGFDEIWVLDKDRFIPTSIRD